MLRVLGVLLVVTSAAAACAPEELAVVMDPSTATVLAANRTLMVYQYLPNPAKPYLAQLFSPSGVNVLRDSPADHKHHHGLMFAVAVDGVDFWGETAECGLQRHRGGQQPQNVERGGFALAWGEQEVDWVAPGEEKLMLREIRQVAVGQAKQAAATLVIWQTRLQPPGQKPSVTLSGRPYFGLGMRFVQSMDTGGQLFNADGKTGVDGTNAVRSAWCAYAASAEGKPVTVAIFDHPRNPRHPATWFTMDKPFAYISATLNLSKEPLTIEAGKPLDLRYAVAVWDGRPDKARIDALYRQIVNLPAD